MAPDDGARSRGMSGVPPGETLGQRISRCGASWAGPSRSLPTAWRSRGWQSPTWRWGSASQASGRSCCWPASFTWSRWSWWKARRTPRRRLSGSHWSRRATPRSSFRSRCFSVTWPGSPGSATTSRRGAGRTGSGGVAAADRRAGAPGLDPGERRLLAEARALLAARYARIGQSARQPTAGSPGLSHAAYACSDSCGLHNAARDNIGGSARMRQPVGDSILLPSPSVRGRRRSRADGDPAPQEAWDRQRPSPAGS